MSWKRVAVGLSLGMGLVLLAPAALADVPGPREVCETEGMACESCWQPYGGPEEQAGFEACKAPLAAKGYVEGCRNRQGAGDSVYFCAPGATPEKVTKGGGCGACTVGSTSTTGAFVAMAIGLGLLAARRRKSPRKAP